MIYLGDGAVGIDDERLAFLRSVTEAASLTYIPLVILSRGVSNGVRIHHVAADFHRSVVLWNNQTVALTQDDVVVAAGVGQSLVKLNADGIGRSSGERTQADGIFRSNIRLCHLDE